MDTTITDQSAGSGNTARLKLRYPLRSATKPKEDISTSSAPKSERSASNVSKSVSVVDLSGKDKSTKPPRRLSIPAKSTISPLPPRQTSIITPISENKTKRSTSDQGRSGTPVSDASKLMNQRKFSVLSSASYWLSQIKLSESVAKHSISLGFFKLALESGCEPLKRMRDELKSYACRHDLVELGEPVKELLRSYNILEDLEQLQVSETCSQALGEGTQSSDEVVYSSSTTGTRKLKPKSLNLVTFEASTAADSAKKDGSQKKFTTRKNKGSLNSNSANSQSVTDIGAANIQKKSQRPSRLEANKEKAKDKNQGKKSAAEKVPVDPMPLEETQQEDKENMDAQQMEEIILTEVM